MAQIITQAIATLSKSPINPPVAMVSSSVVIYFFRLILRVFNCVLANVVAGFGQTGYWIMGMIRVWQPNTGVE